MTATSQGCADTRHPLASACDVAGSCCLARAVCSADRFLCASNFTIGGCGEGECRVEGNSVCCPSNSQCCLADNRLSCCVETEIWWKWPALIASSSFLLLTFLLLYLTFRNTRARSHRRSGHVIHCDVIPTPPPPPYQSHWKNSLILGSPPLYRESEVDSCSVEVSTLEELSNLATTDEHHHQHHHLLGSDTNTLSTDQESNLATTDEDHHYHQHHHLLGSDTNTLSITDQDSHRTVTSGSTIRLSDENSELF